MAAINCFTNVDTVLINLKDGSQRIVFSNTSSSPVAPSLSNADKAEVTCCLNNTSVSKCCSIPTCPVNFTQAITDDCGKRANASVPTNRVTYKLPETYASKLESCWGGCGTLLFDAQYTIYCCAYSRYSDHRIIVHAFNCYLMNSTSFGGDCFDRFTTCTMFSYGGLKAAGCSSCLPTSYSSTSAIATKYYCKCFPIIAVVRTGPGDYYIWPGPNLTDFKIDNVEVL